MCFYAVLYAWRKGPFLAVVEFSPVVVVLLPTKQQESGEDPFKMNKKSLSRYVMRDYDYVTFS